MTVFLVLGLVCLIVATAAAVRSHRRRAWRARDAEQAAWVRRSLRRMLGSPEMSHVEVVGPGEPERSPLPRRRLQIAHLASWSLSRCQAGPGPSGAEVDVADAPGAGAPEGGAPDPGGGDAGEAGRAGASGRRPGRGSTGGLQHHHHH